MNSREMSVDAYITDFPGETKEILRTIRNLIRRILPEAEEVIKYGIPTFTQGKNVIHYAAYKKHIGLYPAPSGVEAFKTAFKEYKTGKGSIQFPLDKPIPYDLIEKIVVYRRSQLSI